MSNGSICRRPLRLINAKSSGGGGGGGGGDRKRDKDGKFA